MLGSIGHTRETWPLWSWPSGLTFIAKTVKKKRGKHYLRSWGCILGVSYFCYLLFTSFSCYNCMLILLWRNHPSLIFGWDSWGRVHSQLQVETCVSSAWATQCLVSSRWQWLVQEWALEGQQDSILSLFLIRYFFWGGLNLDLLQPSESHRNANIRKADLRSENRETECQGPHCHPSEVRPHPRFAPALYYYESNLPMHESISVRVSVHCH